MDTPSARHAASVNEGKLPRGLLGASPIELQRICDRTPALCRDSGMWKDLYSLNFPDLFDLVVPRASEVPKELLRGGAVERDLWREVYVDTLYISSVPEKLEMLERMANDESMRRFEGIDDLIDQHSVLFFILALSIREARERVIGAAPDLVPFLGELSAEEMVSAIPKASEKDALTYIKLLDDAEGDEDVIRYATPSSHLLGALSGLLRENALPGSRDKKLGAIARIAESVKLRRDLRSHPDTAAHVTEAAYGVLVSADPHNTILLSALEVLPAESAMLEKYRALVPDKVPFKQFLSSAVASASKDDVNWLMGKMEGHSGRSGIIKSAFGHAAWTGDQELFDLFSEQSPTFAQKYELLFAVARGDVAAVTAAMDCGQKQAAQANAVENLKNTMNTAVFQAVIENRHERVPKEALTALLAAALIERERDMLMLIYPLLVERKEMEISPNLRLSKLMFPRLGLPSPKNLAEVRLSAYAWAKEGISERGDGDEGTNLPKDTRKSRRASLERKSAKELRKMAKTAQVRGRGRMRKEDLISALLLEG